MLVAIAAALAGCVRDAGSDSSQPLDSRASATAEASPSVDEVPSPLPTGTMIDGFTLGVLAACSPPVTDDPKILDESCAGFPKRALAALDAREPGHAAVTSVQMYADGTSPAPIDVTGKSPGPTPPPLHKGAFVYVFVFNLEDRSVRATGISCTDSNPTVCQGIEAYPQ